MPDDLYLRYRDCPPFGMPIGPAEPRAPMAVLSVAPARSAWHRIPVLGAAAAQGLILVALFGGTQVPASEVEPATFEMIQVPPAPQAEPPPEPPPEPVAATVRAPAPGPAPEPVAGTFPAAETEPPPAQPAMPAADALSTPTPKAQPLLPPADGAPEPPAVTQEAALPAPPTPPEATPLPVEAPLLVEPPPPPAEPVPPVRRTVLKPNRPLTRLAVSRPVAPAAAGSPVVLTAVVAPAALASVVTKDSASQLRAEEMLRGRIRDAVQAAVRCPPAAQMMGRSGKAGVTFDYRDGSLMGDVRLTRSTGTPMLDSAALAAVREAHYPKAPPEIAEQVLPLLIWVDEACGG